MIEIANARIDDVVVLDVKGRLDSATSDQLDFAAEMASENDLKLLLDFSQLKYISSAGLRACLMIAKRLQKKQGRLVLCGLSPAVREVFDIAGFSQILDLADDRSAALARLR
jgi:stage II sporulation protein AA (anti-sigma F factor antagonist)